MNTSKASRSSEPEVTRTAASPTSRRPIRRRTHDRLTIFLPAEVGARLRADAKTAGAPSLSAYVAEALEQRARKQTFRSLLDELFREHPMTDKEREWADAILDHYPPRALTLTGVPDDLRKLDPELALVQACERVPHQLHRRHRLPPSSPRQGLRAAVQLSGSAARPFEGLTQGSDHIGKVIDAMERVVSIHIEELPEGLYLATSDELQGLVAQGRTVAETLEIARDVARKLLEAQAERQGGPQLAPVGKSFDYPLVVGG